MAVITIGGQFGAGALEIGDAVAKSLQIDYVERTALPMVARRVNATVEAVWLKENHLCTWKERMGSVLERMFTYAGTYGTTDEAAGYVPQMYDPYFAFPVEPGRIRERPHEIPDDEYIEAMGHVNSELADSGDLVLTLRGGSANLQDREDAFHVGLFAPMDRRVARVANRRRWSPTDAADFIEARQDRRSDFFRRTVGTDQSDKELYDVVINTARMSDSRAVLEIVEKAKVFGLFDRLSGPILDPLGVSEIQHVKFD